MPSLQELSLNPESRKVFWCNILIALLVVGHFILLTTIFVTQKKAARLEVELKKLERTAKKQAPKPPLESKPVSPQTLPPESEREVELKAKLTARPENVKVQEKLAHLYYQEGKVAVTIEQYKKMLELKPNDPGIHLALAQVYMAEKKFSREAMFHFQKVLQLDPKHPRKMIVEQWVQELERQAKQVPTTTPANPQSREKFLAHLKTRLAEESNPARKKHVELLIRRMEQKPQQEKSQGKKETK